MLKYPILDICIFPTSIRIKMKDECTAANGMNLDEFVRGITEFFYNHRMNKWLAVRRYAIYEPTTKIASFPRYILKDLVNFTRFYGGEVNLMHASTNPGRDVAFKLNPWWKPRENQIPAIDFLIGKNSTHKMRALPLQTGQGKGQPLSAKIKVPNGWITMGKMRVGYTVSTPDGKTAVVDGVFPQGKRKCYKITFDDGRTTICDENHLWKVCDKKDATYNSHWWKVLITKQLVKLFDTNLADTNKNVYVPLVLDGDADDKLSLAMPPYIMGALISGKCKILPDGLSFHNNHVAERVASLLLDSSIAKISTMTSVISPDLVELIQLFDISRMLSWERVLTSEYLNGSADQRMELLNGIIDAAGVVSSGKNPLFKVLVHSHKLALQIQQLVRSVGGWCKLYISEHRSHIYKGVRKTGRAIYGLSIKHPNMTRLVTDPDKRFKISENHYDDKMKLRIRNIEYIGEQETQCISIDHEDHLYITDDFIVTHNTFSSLMAAATIGKATIVILNGLIDQWYDTIVTGRDGKPAQFIIDPKEVYIIQGQKSLVDLIENDKYKPSIVLASLPTIRNYISANTFPYNEILPFGALMERMGIGTKINDEAHQSFSAIVDIDLRANINNNLYLSATLTRGDKQSKKIFERIFPSVMRFDVGELKRYVNVFYHSYNIGPFLEASVSHKQYGYNQNKYEMVILNSLDKRIMFFETVANYFHSYYLTVKKPGQKCMILIGTRLMGDELSYFFTNEYPDLKVGTYFGGGNLADLKDCDLIISTAKKGGTGTDIDELLTVINTMSIGSEVLPMQIFGRLRELKNGDTPIYVCMYNEMIDSHYTHYMFCRKLYRTLAKTFTDLTRQREEC